MSTGDGDAAMGTTSSTVLVVGTGIVEGEADEGTVGVSRVLLVSDHEAHPIQEFIAHHLDG